MRRGAGAGTMRAGGDPVNRPERIVLGLAVLVVAFFVVLTGLALIFEGIGIAAIVVVAGLAISAAMIPLVAIVFEEEELPGNIRRLRR
jgi:hypothetical protein